MTTLKNEALSLDSFHCTDTLKPHVAHNWYVTKDDEVHCKGVPALTREEIEQYTTEDCHCEYCNHIRQGKRGLNPMCIRKWKALSEIEQKRFLVNRSR